MKEELLFMRLVFGFRRFISSFPQAGLNTEVPSFDSEGGSEASSVVGRGSSSLPFSCEARDSFSLSLML